MSRSNRTSENENPNPCKLWLEWSAKEGKFTYYDKSNEMRRDMELPITFMLLDELSCIKGWHDLSGSGIYSNEVRSTGRENLVVKAFKGGEIANGLYADIKNKVVAAGGKYNKNLYVAVKIEGQLQLASIMLKGAALGEWMEWSKENRAWLFDRAVTILGTKDGKKGSVKFLVPTFKITEVSEDTNTQAIALDEDLQRYLKTYLLSRTDGGITPPVTTASEPVNDDDLPF